MTDLEVIITDGIDQRRVIWVSLSRNGIYYYYTLKTAAGGDYHTSYHKDGSVWNTHNGVRRKIAQHQPLKSFKDRLQLSNMTFSNRMGQVGAAPLFKMGKLDSAIHIDVRPYKKKHFGIGIRLILLEPGKYSLLKGLERVAKEIHVYPGFQPWFVIVVYETDFPPKNIGGK